MCVTQFKYKTFDWIQATGTRRSAYDYARQVTFQRSQRATVAFPMSEFLNQGCTNVERLVGRATKFCMVAPYSLYQLNAQYGLSQWPSGIAGSNPSGSLL
jgi:hypothetical protein